MIYMILLARRYVRYIYCSSSSSAYLAALLITYLSLIKKIRFLPTYLPTCL